MLHIKIVRIGCSFEEDFHEEVINVKLLTNGGRLTTTDEDQLLKVT